MLNLRVMTEVAAVRVLVPGDEPRLFELLEQHLDSSLILLSNVEKAGLVDRAETFQGTYAASFSADGSMLAVAGHQWNGNVVVQGDAGLERAVSAAVAASGRAVRGLIGPLALAMRARRALGLDDTKAKHDERELLFRLRLDQLVVPAPLPGADIQLRAPTAEEAAGVLARWRADYLVEALGSSPSAELEQTAREQTIGWRQGGTLWVLLHGGAVVAMTGFNAEARGVVQVGGVFTPPQLRGRGYARRAVAASLQLARVAGAKRSVLFTTESNAAARRAYTALGYELVADFGLILF